MAEEEQGGGFGKIAQVALPALAGAAAAFDPYRQVSRGLNQAVVMRSRLKGQADRQAYREQQEERAIADQEMQRQRQDWAEINFNQQQEIYGRAKTDYASFQEYKNDLKGSSEEELWPMIDAARSFSDLSPILKKKQNLEMGGRMISAIQSLDPQGQYVTPELMEIIKRNPSWGQSVMAGLASMRQKGTPEQQALQQYQGIINNIGEALDQGIIDASEAVPEVMRVMRSGPMGIQPPDWLTPEMIGQAEFETGRKELAPLYTERGEIYKDYARQAQQVVDAYNAKMAEIAPINDPRQKQVVYEDAQQTMNTLWNNSGMASYNAKLGHYYPEDRLDPLPLQPPATVENPEADAKMAGGKSMKRGRETNTASRGRVPQRNNDFRSVESYLEPEFSKLQDGGG